VTSSSTHSPPAVTGQQGQLITVMFTDIKGSTTINEMEGDLVSRNLIKIQGDIVQAAIKASSGIFVKSIGDGTLSYFKNALDAVRAAIHIQQEIDKLNMLRTFKFLVLMRIGMHTGQCVVEENDIYGDVVNTASRFESAADGGGILMSEETYQALPDKTEIYCRFAKQVNLKGKAEKFNAYKIFWNTREVELDKQDQLAKMMAAQAVQSNVKIKTHWVLGGLIGGIILLLIYLGDHFWGDNLRNNFFGSGTSAEKRRTIGDPAPVVPPPR